jgi:cell division protein FtsZ
MEDASLLLVGVGGLGCTWANRAKMRCGTNVDLLLIDADPSGVDSPTQAHVLTLGDSPDSSGCASLPELGEQRMRNLTQFVNRVLEPVELVILLTALGGGSGSGAAPDMARQAKRRGALVLSIAALPFDAQPSRRQVAEEACIKLEEYSDVCVRLSLDRLAWQARERGVDWRLGAAWVEELVEGLVTTISKIGLINLDLMDLRSIVQKDGRSTLLVAEGDPDSPMLIFQNAVRAPLYDVQIQGARGCLIQVEGGIGMTIQQLEAVASAFTSGLHRDAQVILGARTTSELEGKIRVVAVISGAGLPT